MRVRRALAALCAAALAVPASALAHGDPTAHYLETDSLLTSYAAPPDVAVELQLRGALDAAAARGYPIKVVLFADENDTGGDPEPLEDPQAYVKTVSDQLIEVQTSRAPVVIVTPDRFAVGGRQPRDRTLIPITDPLAAELTRNLPLPQGADGNALARAAMSAVRRLAADGGYALPERIPPAKNNPMGILGNANRDSETVGGSWSIAGVIAVTALLGALLVVVYRRSLREPELDTADEGGRSTTRAAPPGR